MAERDKNGRFASGNGGGPGRPKRSTEEKYIKALAARVSLSDWREIVDAAVAKAKRGDPRARQWLSDYLLGPPVKRLEHSGVDGGAIIVRWEDDTNDAN